MPQPDDPPPLLPPARKPGMFAALRSSFLAGLVVIAPIGITIWLIWTLIGWMDGWVMPFVPAPWRPEQYIGIDLRGVGVALFLMFTVLIGWLAKGFVGRSLIRTGEGLVDRMPIVRSIYGGLKQIAETVLSQTETRFDRACMIEYPRRGLWDRLCRRPRQGRDCPPSRPPDAGGLSADNAQPDIGISAVCARR